MSKSRTKPMLVIQPSKMGWIFNPKVCQNSYDAKLILHHTFITWNKCNIQQSWDLREIFIFPKHFWTHCMKDIFTSENTDSIHDAHHKLKAFTYCLIWKRKRQKTRTIKLHSNHGLKNEIENNDPVVNQGPGNMYNTSTGIYHMPELGI